MALLQGPSAKQAEVIKQELGEGGDDLERGVRDLMSMCAAVPHLPQPNLLHRNILELFVRGCRLDTERAREKFEAFCLARARHRDLYEYRSLNEPPLNDFCKFMDVIPLPKLTDEGLRVTVMRIRPDYPNNSDDIVNAVRAILLISDCRMYDEKLIAGDVFVYEISAVRASLAARIAAALGAVRRGVHLAHAAYPQRLKRIHIVGAQPFIASSIQLLRNCLSEKIKKRFLLHSKMEELLDHIPARVLPVEWGGTEDPIDALTKRWRRRVDELRDYLRELNEYSNSTAEHINDKDIYGTMGAFRKLDID